MQITVNKKDFLTVLKYIQLVIERVATRMILQDFLIITEKDKENIELLATDGRVYLKCKCRAEIRTEGSITISARKTLEIINLLDGDIDIETDDKHWVTISSNKTEFKLPGHIADEFPVKPEVSKETEGTKVSIPLEAIKQSLPLVKYAIQSYEVENALSCLKVEINGTYKLIGTDGHRLCISEHEKDAEKVEDRDILLPIKVVNVIESVIKNQTGDVCISGSETIDYIKMGDIQIWSHTVTAEFPNYTLVLSESYEREVVFNKYRLLQSMKRANIVSSGGAVGVTFKLSDNLFIITGETEVGNAYDEFEIEYNTTDFIASYNPQYIIDILNAIDSENVVFRANAPEGPAIFAPVDDDSYIALVMPMRVRD